MDIFEKAWEQREEEIYPSLFGTTLGSIFVPQDPNKVAIGGNELVLACWGVFEIKPSQDRDYWTYITSGPSNPEVDAKESSAFSGLGFEMMIHTPSQCYWPIHLLIDLMGYLLETGNFFDEGHRMPLNTPIDGDPSCLIDTVLFWSPQSLPHSFQLISGKVEILELIGITSSEYEYAQQHSSFELYKLLKQLPRFPITDPTRASCPGIK